MSLICPDSPRLLRLQSHCTCSVRCFIRNRCGGICNTPDTCRTHALADRPYLSNQERVQHVTVNADPEAVRRRGHVLQASDGHAKQTPVIVHERRPAEYPLIHSHVGKRNADGPHTTMPDPNETAVDYVDTRRSCPCAPPLYGSVIDPAVGFKFPCPAEISEVSICSSAAYANGKPAQSRNP
jgi:hypothetical protein